MSIPVWWAVCELVAEKHGLVASIRYNKEKVLISVSSEETSYDHVFEGQLDQTINPLHYYVAMFDICEKWWKQQARHVKAEKRRARNKRNK